MKDEFAQRLSIAKKHRQEYIDEAAREVYKFCFNGRETEWDGSKRRDDEPEEIFADDPGTISEEFAGELFSTMTPENAPWVEYEPGHGVDPSKEAEAQESLEQFEVIMDAAVRASNYYHEGPTAFQDAVVGNVVLWAERPTLNSAIVFEAVPLAECHFRLGPNGIDDRFRTQKYAYTDLPVLLPRATFPKKIKDKINKGSTQNAKVCYGFWKTHKDPENPIWVMRVRVDGEPVGLDDDLGEDGSCPMIVGRFNPMAKSAWGRGPGLRMLPKMRVLDELTRMGIEGMDRTLDPAIFYPNDGVIDLSDGIESGMAYPTMPGSTDHIKEMGLGGALDYGFFAEDRIVEAMRYGFYREPGQKGKTPPSASQYVGEEQKTLRRIARPAAKLWSEIGVGVLKRVEYLERQPGGSLVGVEIPIIDSGQVIVRPISPLERAQAREEVLVAQSIMGMTMENLGPEQAAMVIDGPKTMGKVKSVLKDKIVEFRSNEEIQQIMQMQQPQQQQVPNGEPPPQA